VTAFSRELQAFGKSDATVTASTGSEVSTKTKRGKKDEYNMRLDVLTPAFRSGIAGAARLSGDLAGAMREIEEAERSAKIAGTCLFKVETAVERARIHLAMGARDEAVAVLTSVRDDRDPHVDYRRAELERLLSELR
jgi:ATP/maltotriose-dependent transcriptional regulator MalT